MFKTGNVYTHKNMLDTEVMVFRAKKLEDGSYDLRVRYFLKSGLDLGAIEDVTVKAKDLEHWYEVS